MTQRFMLVWTLSLLVGLAVGLLYRWLGPDLNVWYWEPGLLGFTSAAWGVLLIGIRDIL